MVGLKRKRLTIVSLVLIGVLLFTYGLGLSISNRVQADDQGLAGTEVSSPLIPLNVDDIAGALTNFTLENAGNEGSRETGGANAVSTPAQGTELTGDVSQDEANNLQAADSVPLTAESESSESGGETRSLSAAAEMSGSTSNNKCIISCTSNEIKLSVTKTAVASKFDYSWSVTKEITSLDGKNANSSSVSTVLRPGEEAAVKYHVTVQRIYKKTQPRVTGTITVAGFDQIPLDKRDQYRVKDTVQVRKLIRCGKTWKPATGWYDIPGASATWLFSELNADGTIYYDIPYSECTFFVGSCCKFEYRNHVELQQHVGCCCRLIDCKYWKVIEDYSTSFEPEPEAVLVDAFTVPEGLEIAWEGSTYTSASGQVQRQTELDFGNTAADATWEKDYTVTIKNTGLSSGSADFTNTAKLMIGNSKMGEAQACVTVTASGPALSISKSADKTIARVGDKMTYTVTVANTGTVPLSDVYVSDPQAPGGRISIGDLAAGEESKPKTYERTITTGDLPGPLVNSAQAVGTFRQKDDVRSDTVSCKTYLAAIKITKSANPRSGKIGDSVVYTYTVKNIGSTNIENLKLTDDKLPGIKIALGATDLAPGEETSGGPVTYAIKASDITIENGQKVVRNTALAIASPVVKKLSLLRAAVAATDTSDPSSANTSIEVRATADEVIHIIDSETPQQKPDIKLEKSADPTSGWIGTTVKYTFTITNTGDMVLYHVVLKDDLIPEYAGAGKEIVGSLAPGSTVTVHGDYVVKDSDVGEAPNYNTSLVNEALVYASVDPEGEGDYVFDEARVSVALSNPGTPVPGKKAGITLDKSADRIAARDGETIVYTYTVKNTGDYDLTVTISDSVEGSIQFPNGSYSYVLTPGRTVTATKNHTVASSDPNPLTNIATAVGMYSDGSSSGSVSAQDSWSVIINRSSGGGGGNSGGTGGGSSTGGSSSTSSSTVTTASQAPAAPPVQSEPVTVPPEEAVKEPVEVPAEPEVAVPKGELPFTGGAPMAYMLSGLATLLIAAITSRRYN